MDCIFCKIVSGEIPSYKVYEDDSVLAFLDISQTTLGHLLVIPKEHSTNIFDINRETYLKVQNIVHKLSKAILKLDGVEGVNVLNNNNEAAGQTVFHYHTHIIPRYSKDAFSITFENNMNKYNDKFDKLLKDLSDNIE